MRTRKQETIYSFNSPKTLPGCCVRGISTDDYRRSSFFVLRVGLYIVRVDDARRSEKT